MWPIAIKYYILKEQMKMYIEHVLPFVLSCETALQ